MLTNQLKLATSTARDTVKPCVHDLTQALLVALKMLSSGQPSETATLRLFADALALRAASAVVDAVAGSEVSVSGCGA